MRHGSNPRNSGAGFAPSDEFPSGDFHEENASVRLHSRWIRPPPELPAPGWTRAGPRWLTVHHGRYGRHDLEGFVPRHPALTRLPARGGLVWKRLRPAGFGERMRGKLISRSAVIRPLRPFSNL